MYGAGTSAARRRQCVLGATTLHERYDDAADRRDEERDALAEIADDQISAARAEQQQPPASAEPICARPRMSART